MRSFYFPKWTLCLALALSIQALFAANNPFLGSWELTIPGGGAGWLGVKETGGDLKASMMWGGGSVEPLTTARMENEKLVLTRVRTVQKKDAEGKTTKVNVTETLTATTDGDKISFLSVKPRENGTGEVQTTFGGKRTPPMPAAPNLKRLTYGKPVRLFNGRDLTGWRLTSPGAVNGWSAKDGVLVNSATHAEGQPRKNYGNLRTEAEFEDFNLKLEARVPEKGNSGIYLRGIYEVQVADSYGQDPESHRNGAVYSRITPTSNPSRRAGEWQSYDITLADRHVTVVLNGKTIIDNQLVEGCTGGALWSDVSRPGPIYLQGDHTAVEFRNIVLKPVSRR